MMGAGDVAGAAGAGADPGRGLDHGADHLGVLAHAEIVVGAPDHDVARALRGVPDRMRKPARDALEIGENPVAPLVMQAVEGGTEKLAVIHRKTWNGTRPGAASAFLEPFQLCCLCEIRHSRGLRDAPEAGQILIWINTLIGFRGPATFYIRALSKFR